MGKWPKSKNFWVKTKIFWKHCGNGIIVLFRWTVEGGPFFFWFLSFRIGSKKNTEMELSFCSGEHKVEGGLFFFFFFIFSSWFQKPCGNGIIILFRWTQSGGRPPADCSVNLSRDTESHRFNKEQTVFVYLEKSYFSNKRTICICLFFKTIYFQQKDKL